MNRSAGTLMDGLQTGVVLFAEGCVFELERRGYLKAQPIAAEMAREFPKVVAEW